MVTPGAQLILAEEIFALGTEEAFRTAVSRAYYASFWHCRTIVEERIGPLDESGPEVHRRVSELLALIDEGRADILVRLRQRRNFADYAPARPFGRADAFVALAWARLLIP